MRYLGFKNTIGRFRLLGPYVSGIPNCANRLEYADKRRYALSHIKITPK